MPADRPTPADRLVALLPELVAPDRDHPLRFLGREIGLAVFLGLAALFTGPLAAALIRPVPELPAPAESALNAAEATAADFAIYALELTFAGAQMVAALLLALTAVFQLRLVRRSWLGMREAMHAAAGYTPRRRESEVVLAMAVVLALTPVWLDPGLKGLDFAAWMQSSRFGPTLVILAIPALFVVRGTLGRAGLSDYCLDHAPSLTLGLAGIAATLAIEAGFGRLDFLGALHPFAGARWSGAALAVAGALIAGATAVTVFGVRAVAHNFPDPATVDWHLHRHRLNAAALIRALKQEPGLWQAMQAALPDPARPLPANPRLEAGVAKALINALVQALALGMIAALVVLSFGLELAVARLALSGDVAEAAAKAAKSLLYLTGAGFSVVLALIWLGGMIRVDTYADAYARAREALKPDAPPAPRAWHGSVTLAGEAGLDLDLREGPRPKPATVTAGNAGAGNAQPGTRALPIPSPEPDDPDDTALQAHIGADRTRLAAILSATSIGASFHTLTQSDLKERAGRIATLLGPAMASGVLGLLG